MKKLKNKSASKPTSPMNLLRGAIGQKTTKPLRSALNAFKTAGLTEKFSLAYVLASASAQFPHVLTASRKLTDLGALGSAPALITASLTREIQWAAVTCYAGRELLNQFVPLREEFFRALVGGDFEAAESLLDRIVNACGESSWVLENRIALLSLAGGFEKQKKYVQQVTRLRKRSHVSFIAANFGERNEPRVTAASFLQRLKTRAKSWDISAEHRAYIFYKLNNIIEPTEKCFAAILAHEGSCSVVDVYETLLDLIRRSKSERFCDPEISVAALGYLEVSDVRISRLSSFLLDKDPVRTFVEHDVGATDNFRKLFISGHYAEAGQASLEAIKKSPSDLPAIWTYSKVHAIGEAPEGKLGWFAQTLSDNLSTLYSAQPGTKSAADALLKLAVNLRHADFSEALVGPIVRRTFKGFAARKNIVESAHVYLDFKNLSMLASSHDGLEVADHPADTGNGERGRRRTSAESASYYSMHDCIAKGELDAALEYAEKLEHSTHAYFRMQGACFSAHILAKSLRTESAIEKSVSICVANPESVIFTPLVDLVSGKGFRELKSLASNPALAAAFYIYMEETGRTDKEVSLKVAWKRYLSEHGVDRPSTLPFLSLRKPSLQEVFFLSEVCRQETMELGGAFSSQIDLDRERMQICIRLAQVDAERLDVYDQEIVDLTRRINIEEGVEYLESSRVFVDEIGVQSWAKKNLESQFLRYIDYLKAGLFSSARELEDEIYKIAVTSKNRKTALANYLDEYDVSAETLLEDILTELGEAFLLLPRFGLDAFLSSRVRHGSFVGYLRGPLESKRLVTKKNSTTGKYQENEHILNKWGIASFKERNSASAKLNAFSESIDQMLDESVSKYLHVRSKSRPEGMVNFLAERGSGGKVIKRWLLMLKATLNQNSTLELLVSHCFQNFFWPSVKLSLNDVQYFVKNDLGSRLIYTIDALAESIRPMLGESERNSLLADKFYAKAEVRAAVDRVALWFDTPKNNTQMLTMNLQRTIEIGLRSTKNARPDFNPTVTWKVASDANIEISGPAIGVMNDISFLIFENVSKHSGFEEGIPTRQGSPEVEVSITLQDKVVEIFVVSEISERKDLDEVQRGIASAKNKIRNREFDIVTQNVKGTGLVRLAINSGSSEGTEADAVKFGLDESGYFYVRFNIPRGVVEAVTQSELIQ